MLLKYVITCNIANSDIQDDILSHTNQDLSLQELIKFIEAKEAGMKSKASLDDYQTSAAMKSSYRKESHRNFNSHKGNLQNTANTHKPPGTTAGANNSPLYSGKGRPYGQPNNFNNGGYSASSKGPICDWCGYPGHGDGSNLDQRTRHCPAFGQQCNYCKRYNHFKTKCRVKPSKSKTSAVSTEADDEQQGAFLIYTIHTSPQ